MSKRKYTVEEAAEFILSDVPLDNAIDTDIEYDSDEVDVSVSEIARLPHKIFIVLHCRKKTRIQKEQYMRVRDGQG